MDFGKLKGSLLILRGSARNLKNFCFEVLKDVVDVDFGISLVY